MNHRHYRIVFALGALLYPAWYFIFAWLVPGAEDSLLGRGLVSLLALGGFALTFLRRAHKRLDLVLLALVVVMGLHYVFLIRQNALHVNYLIGAFVVLASINAVLESWRLLAVFNVFFLGALTWSFQRADSMPISGFVVVGGLLTVSFIQCILILVRNELQRKLRSSAALSSIGEMAGEIAHEISNPLSVILHRAQQIDRQLGAASPEVTPQTLQAVKSIEKTAKRIDRIVKGMRTLSRDASHDPFSPVTVGQIVEDTVGICGDKMKACGVELVIEGDLSLRVSGRPTQLCQVVLNLFNNAIDALEHAPEKKIRLRVVRDRDDVLLQVSDSGPGIPNAVRRRMFQPFFTTKASGKGTGLGLTISRRILEEHGGSLVLEPTRETTLTLRIPALEETPAALAA